MTAALARSDHATVSSPREVRGELSVPGDKSISHRSALFNAIAEGRARVERYSPGGDCRSTLDCLAALGVPIRAEPDTDGNLTLEIEGRGLRGLAEAERVLDAGNSGTTTRLMAGILAGQTVMTILDGDDSLRSRPMQRIVTPLREMGATILGRQDGDRLPLAIRGGRLRGMEHRPRVASAQVKSALLLAGLFGDDHTTVIEVAPTRDHTERMLQAQGVRVEQNGPAVTVRPPERLAAIDLTVPGDFSSAAYWLALACAHPDARVTVRGVGLNPGRTGLLEVLAGMGARVWVEAERLAGGEPVGDVTAESSELRGVEVSGELVPRLIDEVPLIAMLATFARGTTRIRDAAELRVKESDRIATTARELSRLGGVVRALDDGLEIVGGHRLRSAEVDSHADHRLAMCLAIAGLAAGGADIAGAGAADVSYPSFWDHARALGGGVNRE